MPRDPSGGNASTAATAGGSRRRSAVRPQQHISSRRAQTSTNTTSRRPSFTGPTYSDSTSGLGNLSVATHHDGNELGLMRDANFIFRSSCFLAFESARLQNSSAASMSMFAENSAH